MRRDYEPPIEISDSSLVTSLTINTVGLRVYEGEAVCNEVSEDGGRFILGWYARKVENGYEINPTKREGIDAGLGGSNRFTHSSIFDQRLRDFITGRLLELEERA